MVCGTDGVTYANHCKFVHAACQFENLHVHNHGACPPNFSTSTTPPGVTMAAGGQSAAGTTLPSSAYIQSMFCRNKDSIGCPAVFSIVCGSNGMDYPNTCELSKAVCDLPNLVEVPCSGLPTTQPPATQAPTTTTTTTTPRPTTTKAGPIPIIG
uniref:Agrin-like n=1 Tax=Crassostrea virginica TaxID=6565 RepID=A0A8B8BMQ3_CRAVI|nr:agrin-like [Crassostrea virginica]